MFLWGTKTTTPIVQVTSIGDNWTIKKDIDFVFAFDVEEGLYF